MSQPAGQFDPGKLMDFFRFFDPTRPQHTEAVRRFERSLLEKAPELLNDLAYWVQAWRTPPTPKPRTPQTGGPIVVKVKPQYQHSGDSCGRTACAMAIVALTGKPFTDESFGAKYGPALLLGLQRECPGWEWWDQGDVGPDQWDDLEACLRAGGVAVAAGNGPHFSKSGRGHIVTIVNMSGSTITFADPAIGAFRSVTKEQWETAARHPQGNFLFLCKK